MKEVCLADPDKKLFLGTSKGKREIVEIFLHIKSLLYEQRPDYAFIRNRIQELMTKEYMKLNYINPTFPFESEKVIESPSKDIEALCKSSKNRVNSSFTNSGNVAFPFQTPFDGYNNLLDNSNKNIINTNNTRNLFNGMKQNDLNISNFYFRLQNDLNNRLSLFNCPNQLTKKKRHRDDGIPHQYYEEEGELPKKGEDNNLNNLTTNLPFNNLSMNNIPIPNPNAQNQIFIINQFNKNNMTDLEKCLLNYLIPQKNNFNTGETNQPNKTNKEKNINNADKLLINNIKSKLQPPKATEANKANSMADLEYMNFYSNLMNMGMLGNNLVPNPLFTDANVLINNYTGLPSPNQIFNVNTTFNNLNNSMDMMKNFIKVNEQIDTSKINYGYPDYLGNEGVNGFNIAPLDQFKQNLGNYSQILSDKLTKSARPSKDIKPKQTKLFKVEKTKK
jgi:hypothetical protein